jgi:hypothetical protein
MTSVHTYTRNADSTHRAPNAPANHRAKASASQGSSSGSHTNIQPAESPSAYPTANAQKLQSNEQALKQELSNYKAVAYTSHGYQGNYIDTTT